jgi:hypothetical protein
MAEALMALGLRQDLARFTTGVFRQG